MDDFLDEWNKGWLASWWKEDKIPWIFLLLYGKITRIIHLKKRSQESNSTWYCTKLVSSSDKRWGQILILFFSSFIFQRIWLVLKTQRTYRICKLQNFYFFNNERIFLKIDRYITKENKINIEALKLRICLSKRLKQNPRLEPKVSTDIWLLGTFYNSLTSQHFW